MHWLRGLAALALAMGFLAGLNGDATAQQSQTTGVLAGPANAAFPAIGDEIRKDLSAPLPAQADWTIKGWVFVQGEVEDRRAIAALEAGERDSLVEILVVNNKIVVVGNSGETLTGGLTRSNQWELLSVSHSDGVVTIQIGENGSKSARMHLLSEATALVLAPRRSGHSRFVGKLAGFTLFEASAQEIPAIGTRPPVDDLILFENGSASWPLQTKQFMGIETPQDPATLPRSRSALVATTSTKEPKRTPSLLQVSSSSWQVGAWKFVAEPEISGTPIEISTPGFDDANWLPATVPGTVLTSYIDNGVYPDPAYGLNNLLIPERLNKQDYWYRTEFVLPSSEGRSRAAFVFGGINYASEIWINGTKRGSTAGAFTRGRVVLPEDIGAGDTIALAVLVSPPPHPGIPHEESLSAGAGKNGGEMTIDGPSFMASEGWDWIPGVRDRNTGLWQPVTLETTGLARIGDPHVATVLPRRDNSLAEVTIEVPVINASSMVQTVTVSAQFGAITLSKRVEVAGNSTLPVRFTPVDHAELRIENPELWWPNGYGEPVLHQLALTASIGGAISDTRTIRFGMREVSYDLSLVDNEEKLQRVTVAPTRSSGQQLVDVRHKNIRKVDGGWAVSLAQDIDASPALASVPETTLAPHLLIRVNGVPIAVRGGNWGMDDWRKRVSRERIEPYFRLHRDANVNTIRNWVGQSTAPVFFDLADEYGLLVLSDFWVSTQNHNGEPADTALFLQNVKDKINRYRHHPSIVLWLGRNEGVPPPVLNEAFERLTREIDGTRAYLPNSRQVNMSGSGPWNFQLPEAYFTRLARGFSTEIGTPSFPTLETFKTMMDEEDLWPISDAWAYHDWHQGGAGGVAPFLKAIRNRLGEATDLADFERKAQLLNFESHRAIFEGMNAGLFTQNSGRLLWMTHPAWPSTAWQIYSHDYDTQASYFGAKRGMEPVHVQMNLPNRAIAIVNSLPTSLDGAQIRVRNFDPEGSLLDDRTLGMDAGPLATTESEIAVPKDLFAKSPLVFTKLELFDSSGVLVSDNFYWLGKDYTSYRGLDRMKAANVSVEARRSSSGDETRIDAVITNQSSNPALMVKLSVLDENGDRVLPAHWSDNYVSLLPGETRNITIHTPATAADPRSIALRGWNALEASVEIAR